MPDNGNLTPGHSSDPHRGESQHPIRQMTDSFVSTEASPSTKLLRIHTQEQQATLRPREPVSETGESAIPPDIVPKTQRIAGPNRIPPLWHYLRGQRTSLPATGADKKPATAEPPDTAEGRIGGLLSRFQMQYEVALDDVYFPELHRRLYLANIYSLYNQETIARRQNPRQRKRKRRTTNNGPKAVNRSLNDIFIDFLLPQLEGRMASAKKLAS
jgi:hypothetical protein